jgi:LAO/AO transport system kinase
MAAGERLGGLAPATRAAAAALAVAFDVVVVETVGVGQSETEVADLTDTVLVVVQPGSGDVLQFLKAGIMEIPDLLVVTKADLGEVATRATADLAAALGALGGDAVPVLPVCSLTPATGIDELLTALDEHRLGLDLPSRRRRARRAQALSEFAAERGDLGVSALGGRRAALRRLEQLDGDLDVPSLMAALDALP